MIEQTILFVTKQNKTILTTYNVQYVLRRVYSKQLAEAFFQRFSYEKVISEAHSKTYWRKPMPNSCMQLQNLS